MKLSSATLLAVVLAVALSPCAAMSQQAPARRSPQTGSTVPGATNGLKVPASAVARFSVESSGDVSHEEQEAAVRDLLQAVDPAETAAELLKIPADEIVLVPHIFWQEPKWLEWSAQANETQISQPTYKPKAGPDGKIPLHVEALYDTANWYVRVEVGPSNVAGGGRDQEIANRLVVKMVRAGEQRTRDFFRQRFFNQMDRLRAQIKDFDDQIDALSHELRRCEGSLLPQAQLSERLADLQRQVLATNLSLDVLKARKAATSDELEKLRQQSASKADNETLHTLKRIVELRKARFDRLKAMNTQGVASREDADKAEEEMLSAMVDLDRATVAAQRGDLQSQLDALAADLSRLAIDRAEAEARAKFLLAARTETEALLDKRRDADLAASRLQDQLKDREVRRAMLQQQLGAADDALQRSHGYLQLSAGF